MEKGAGLTGPGRTFFLPVIKCGKIAVRYDSVVKIANVPTNALKALSEAMYIHPSTVTQQPHTN